MPGKSDKPRGKTVIGWVVNLDLPDWEIRKLRAKVDTGARTSALHVENLKVKRNGKVSFEVVLSRKDREKRVTVEAPIVRRGRVRSSTGDYTRRIFVKTRVKVGAVEKEIEISLVSREKMLFRMLLGRTALARHFLVDVSKRASAKTKKKSDSKPGKLKQKKTSTAAHDE